MWNFFPLVLVEVSASIEFKSFDLCAKISNLPAISVLRTLYFVLRTGPVDSRTRSVGQPLLRA